MEKGDVTQMETITLKQCQKYEYEQYLRAHGVNPDEGIFKILLSAAEFQPRKEITPPEPSLVFGNIQDYLEEKEYYSEFDKYLRRITKT